MFFKMIRDNMRKHLTLGMSFRAIIDAKENNMVHGDKGIIIFIDTFLSLLESNKLYVTSKASFQLKEFVDELKKASSSHVLSKKEAKELNEIIERIKMTFLAESGTQDFFSITEKRIETSKLLDNVEALMAPNIFHSLPDIAQYDFKEAGKCIVFDRPTAAAFHILRGTESTLRQYYCSIVKRKRINSLMWGPILNHLKERKLNKPPAPLLDHLDNIRRNFRNPTQHPEKIYDIDEVQDLFNICVDVVNRMLTHMIVINKNKT